MAGFPGHVRAPQELHGFGDMPTEMGRSAESGCVNTQQQHREGEFGLTVPQPRELTIRPVNF